MKVRSLAYVLFSSFATILWAAEPCFIDVLNVQGKWQLQLNDLEQSFPDLKKKANRGLLLTLFNSIELNGKSTRLIFGCKISYDLWDDRYTVISFLNQNKSEQQPSFVTSLTSIPSVCKTTTLSDNSLLSFKEVKVLSILDPLSEEQLERTREWLAQKGLSRGSQTFFGRALASFIDLHDDQVVTRTCTLRKGA